MMDIKKLDLSTPDIDAQVQIVLAALEDKPNLKAFIEKLDRLRVCNREWVEGLDYQVKLLNNHIMVLEAKVKALGGEP